MKTKRMETMTYETPVMETYELVAEGAILNYSDGVSGGGSNSGTDTPSDDF